MFYYWLWVSNLVAVAYCLLAMATDPGPTAAEIAKAGTILFPIMVCLHGLFVTVWMAREIERDESHFQLSLKAMERGDRLRKLVGES